MQIGSINVYYKRDLLFIVCTVEQQNGFFLKTKDQSVICSFSEHALLVHSIYTNTIKLHYRVNTQDVWEFFYQHTTKSSESSCTFFYWSLLLRITEIHLPHCKKFSSKKMCLFLDNSTVFDWTRAGSQWRIYDEGWVKCHPPPFMNENKRRNMIRKSKKWKVLETFIAININPSSWGCSYGRMGRGLDPMSVVRTNFCKSRIHNVSGKLVHILKYLFFIIT